MNSHLLIFSTRRQVTGGTPLAITTMAGLPPVEDWNRLGSRSTGRTSPVPLATLPMVVEGCQALTHLQ